VLDRSSGDANKQVTQLLASDGGNPWMVVWCVWGGVGGWGGALWRLAFVIVLEAGIASVGTIQVRARGL